MNARTRTLLAMALGVALFAPTAMAQQAETDATATDQTTAPPTQTSDPATQAADQAEQATTQTETAAEAEQSMTQTEATDQAEQATTQAETTDQTEQMTQTDPTKPLPPTSQGAEQAAPHSAVVQRDLWSRLDTDGDGKISATEADADTTFDADFAGIDSDGDGFVSDTEYRTYAKPDTAVGAADTAAGHSAVVTRSTWARLDVDRDGRISAGEADVDTSFDGAFSAMDGDGDGFVTDAEYRAHAQAQSKP